MSQANGVGPRITPEERERARQKQDERRRKQQDEQTARSLAQAGAQQQGEQSPGYWREIADPDLDHPAWSDSIEAFTKAELSRAYALGNISRSEWQDMQLRIDNEFWQMQNEMRSEGSKLKDDDMRLLYGEERADLDDAKARRLRGAREVKKQLASLSVDARGHKGGTEIHAVARTEDGGDEDESGGLFAGLGGYLSR